MPGRRLRSGLLGRKGSHLQRIYLRKPHFLKIYEGDATKETLWRRCSGCYSELTRIEGVGNALLKAKKVRTYCSDCADQPPYCLDCFMKTHSCFRGSFSR